MKKKLTLVLVLLAVTMGGCGDGSYDVESIYDDRFVEISFEKNGRVVYDTQTGVEYWRSSYGLTVLIDEDGKPLIYKGE